MRSIKYYSGYKLWCPKCGFKSAYWSCDGGSDAPTPQELFEIQFTRVTLPSHAEHGAFTIVQSLTRKKSEDVVKAVS